jgi:hypothetical protein
MNDMRDAEKIERDTDRAVWDTLAAEVRKFPEQLAESSHTHAVATLILDARTLLSECGRSRMDLALRKMIEWADDDGRSEQTPRWDGRQFTGAPVSTKSLLEFLAWA